MYASEDEMSSAPSRWPLGVGWKRNKKGTREK